MRRSTGWTQFRQTEMLRSEPYRVCSAFSWSLKAALAAAAAGGSTPDIHIHVCHGPHHGPHHLWPARKCVPRCAHTLCRVPGTVLRSVSVDVHLRCLICLLWLSVRCGCNHAPAAVQPCMIAQGRRNATSLCLEGMAGFHCRVLRWCLTMNVRLISPSIAGVHPVQTPCCGSS